MWLLLVEFAVLVRGGVMWREVEFCFFNLEFLYVFLLCRSCVWRSVFGDCTFGARISKSVCCHSFFWLVCLY